MRRRQQRLGGRRAVPGPGLLRGREREGRRAGPGLIHGKVCQEPRAEGGDSDEETAQRRRSDLANESKFI